mgnify:FL=1
MTEMNRQQLWTYEHDQILMASYERRKAHLSHMSETDVWALVGSDFTPPRSAASTRQRYKRHLKDAGIHELTVKEMIDRTWVKKLGTKKADEPLVAGAPDPRIDAIVEALGLILTTLNEINAKSDKIMKAWDIKET